MKPESSVAAQAAIELHETARRHLAAGDPRAAREVLSRLVHLAPGNVNSWLSFASVLRLLGQRLEEMTALDRALQLDPKHLVGLLQKAALLDLMNKPRTAAGIYTNALQALPSGTSLPPALQAHVQHARARVASNSATLAALMDAQLGMLLSGSVSQAERMRFDRCMARLLGKTAVFNPDPTFMLFPFLINHEFYPRDEFSWLVDLESSTDSIRDELLEVLNEDIDIEPYIAYGDGLPLNQWSELNRSLKWGAYFLWNEGRPLSAHLARCPHTAAALSALPQVDIVGRGPTAFFSLLQGRTTIPAHTGVTNTRLTVHLPLIVPSGCRFRVGGETRTWEYGTGWIFDDTIEHEAWNDSDFVRAILIFDVWNPQLTQLERNLIRESTKILAQFSDAE